MSERVKALNDVLRGLRSEDDSVQLRAIVAQVEAMRDAALSEVAADTGPPLPERIIAELNEYGDSLMSGYDAAKIVEKVADASR